MALCIRHRLLIQLWLQYNHTYIISCHAPENNIHRKNINFRAGEYYYKKYDAKDVKIIKNVEEEVIDEEEKANLKELQELEKLEKMDKKEMQEDDM